MINDANTRPTTDHPDESDTIVRPRLQLSVTQVVASALATITATVAASYLGVAGTVVGAAVASVLTVVGNAVYTHSIQRTGDRVISTVRTAVPGAARFGPRPTVPSRPSPPSQPHRRPPATRRRRTWTVVAASCVGLFAAVLAVVTGVEVVAGRPLSDVVQGKPGSGTSFLGNTSHTTKPTPTPTPHVTVTVTPTVVTSTPTVTVTGTPVTQTAIPSGTASASSTTSAPSDSTLPTVSPSPSLG